MDDTVLVTGALSVIVGGGVAFNIVVLDVTAASACGGEVLSLHEAESFCLATNVVLKFPVKSHHLTACI